MPRRKTHEEFVAEVKELTDGEYDVLGTYINSQTKLLIKHNECDSEWMTLPNNFLRKNRCPKCAGNMKKTTEQFRKEVFHLYELEYEVLGEYFSANEKIRMKHVVCKYEYNVTPNKFLHGRKCPVCYGNKRKNTEQFKKEVFDIAGNEYLVLDNYVNSKTKILIKHSLCNNTYKVTPDNFLRGKRCPSCFGNEIKTNEQFKKEIYTLVGNEYEVLNNYKNAKTKILFKHISCGNTFHMIPNNFLNGYRCPLCAESKGEQIIRHWLENNNIKFVPQYKYSDLYGSGGGLLSYDFFLPDQNCLIEYQGEFHDGSNGEYTQLNLEKQKEHDRRKKKYAERHNIDLLEIWYWDFDNIETILEKELSNFIPQIIQ